MARLGRHIAEGESVRRRINRLNRWVWPLVLLLIVPTVLFWANILWLQDHDQGLLREGLELPFMIFSRITLISAPALFVMFWLARWQVAVTDRRVLVRRGFYAVTHDEIALDEITDVSHDWDAGLLVLSGPGRSLEVPCDDRAAAKILETLHEAYYPKPSLWQRLWDRLRGAAE